jgi:rhamnosyltransferase subunit B
VRAVELRGQRAVLLTGARAENVSERLLKDVIAVDDAPCSGLSPHAAPIVHPGGVGITSRALRVGRRILIMPFSHDQPDNAARCARLGVARTVPRRAARLASDLGALLADSSMRTRAEQAGARIRVEHGARAVVDAIEEALPVPV